MVERQGFEPWRPFWSLHAFQACAFDRSAISPADLLEQGLPKKTKGEYDSPFEHEMVEMSGIEPLTFSLRTRRSPN